MRSKSTEYNEVMNFMRGIGSSPMTLKFITEAVSGAFSTHYHLEVIAGGKRLRIRWNKLRIMARNSPMQRLLHHFKR